MLQHRFQVSESLTLGIVLAISGGFMDAYSYIGRGQVFANAQTGNLILLGISLSEGDTARALRYFFPIVAFAFGIAIAEMARRHVTKLHWRQASVLLEALILIYVCTLGQKDNLLANSLTSLACGIQVQSFRKIHGHAIATTMCLGNLRSATQSIVYYVQTKEKQALRCGLLYYFVIACFVFGAVVGYRCVKHFHELSILVSCTLLLISFFLMFIEREDHANQAEQQRR